jgi:2-polyprenyl-6-methoxyphenol hydroxylase-like FAD-dependent oxidoreductase
MNSNVLICGAGPVGLVLAIELARYGVSVRIVDRSPHRTDKSKALAVWSRTLELLDRAECSASLEKAGCHVTAANIFNGRHQLARISIDHVASTYPFALMIPQAETEALLEQRLLALGVQVERGTEMIRFRDIGDGVEATLRLPDGSEQAVNSAWLVGCDGAHSLVRQTLGLAFDGDTLPSDWVLGDVRVSGLPIPGPEIMNYWQADGALLFLPVSPGRYRIMADVGASQGAHPPTPTLEELQQIVNQRGPGGVVLSEAVWLSGFRINERKVHNYRSGRVFLAGDAAHIHSPAGGQGMNTGMQDAINLAWKLALVCAGTCALSVLDSYSSERSPVAEKVLADSGRLTRVATVQNPAVRSVRDLAVHLLFGFSTVRDAMVTNMSEIAIGYPHSPLNGAYAASLDGPKPGERFAPRGSETPIGSGSAPRFAAIGRPTPALAECLRRHADLVETNPRAPLHDEGLWLVRPDGYVACCVRAGMEGSIDGYLASLQ